MANSRSGNRNCSMRKSQQPQTDHPIQNHSVIAENELEALQELAQELLARTAKQLDEAIQSGVLLEICNDN
jgi:hypothetical protein